MKVYRDIEPMRQLLAGARCRGLRTAVVPTMGALHEGHFSLMNRARAECDLAVATIFVNPTQFGPNEDFDAYPRMEEQDLAGCEACGMDAVFMPDVQTMYPPGAKTTIHVADLPDTLCGVRRPGHFHGVCTVVAKLLNICPAEFVYMGQKDFQQTVVLKRMVADLNIASQIVVCPTVREVDGLARSSRNAYLSPGERAQAPGLYRALQRAAERIGQSPAPAGEIIADIRRDLAETVPDGEIDYVQIVNPNDLRDVETAEAPVAVALAVQLGKARLIDNVLVLPDPA